MSDIRVDAEFLAMIPPLTTEELAQLEQNIVRDGCLSPLVAWKERHILLDGHNRKEICDRRSINYTVRWVSLPDRDAAADWIDANQLGRRNLTPDQMSLLRGRRYNRLKQNQQDNLTQNRPKGQNVTSKDTAERLSQEHGVDARTIKRDGQYADAVEKLGIQREAAAGNLPVARKAVVEVAKALPEAPTKTQAQEAKKAVLSPPEPKPELKTDSAKSPATDAVGNVLPQKLVAAFARVGEIKSLQREVSALKGKILQAASRPDDLIFARLDVSAVEADLKHVFGLLKAITPHAVCPYCKGGERGGAANCTACKGQGWVDEFNYRAAPKEMKA